MTYITVSVGDGRGHPLLSDGVNKSRGYTFQKGVTSVAIILILFNYMIKESVRRTYNTRRIHSLSQFF